eukprot:9436339-Pyramimonas_sp.AAC.1
MFHHVCSPPDSAVDGGVGSRTRANHHRPAPLPSLKGVGRPNQQLRLRRSPAPALLYRSNESP